MEDLHDEVAAGRIGVEDEVFDSSTGAWSPAGKIPVFQFIVEELEAEGRLPERLKAPETPETPETPEVPVRPDPARSSGEAQSARRDRDPFDLSLDLVDSGPPVPGPDEGESGGGPSADEPAAVRPARDASREGNDARDGDGTEAPLKVQVKPEDLLRPADEDDFNIQPGSALDEDWQALSRVDSSVRDRGREAGLDRTESKGDRRFREPEEEARHSLRGSDPSDRADPGDDEAVPWQPDTGDQSTEASPKAGETPSPRRISAPLAKRGSGGLLAAVVGGVLLLVGGGWFLLTGGQGNEPDRTVLEAPVPAPAPPPSAPPPPAGAEDRVPAGLQGVEDRFRMVMDSLRAELDLAPAPPREWLSGAYLADAAAFPQVRGFWEGYQEFLRRMQPLDGKTYLEGVEMGLEAEDNGGNPPVSAYFQERYSGLRSYRMARYESLAAVTRAALNLHDVLARHRAEISFSPAVGRGVSADPILEAVIPDGPVRREVEAALDQVFRALDRSRGGGVPTMDGLRSELFERFGEG
ncbi:MAG: hypothetical protein EA422_10245 [Gemmatimonadales bacterium]|nr:MAG: hypothetical protein EA422_10245 [Gemmatimonadales bacterium]